MHACRSTLEDPTLVVVDLASGESRRVLAAHPSTKATGITLTIGGAPFLRNGQPPQVHSDGIAYDPAGDWLYYQALSARTMYRIPAAALRDASLSAEAVASRVEVVGETGAADGLLFHEGKVWITALERDAILTVGGPGAAPEVVVHDARLAWPDSLAVGPRGDVYVTTSVIHDDGPFGIWKIVRSR